MPRPAPTIPLDPSNPTEKSARCMWPPRPPAHPVALPYSSAMTDRGSMPLARATWWLRCDAAATSSGPSTEVTPTATASWPVAACMPPGIAPDVARGPAGDPNSRVGPSRPPRPRPAWCALSAAGLDPGQDGAGADLGVDVEQVRAEHAGRRAFQ